MILIFLKNKESYKVIFIVYFKRKYLTQWRCPIPQVELKVRLSKWSDDCFTGHEDQVPEFNFQPSRTRRLRRDRLGEDGPAMSMSFEDSSDEEIRESGAGILEFSPAKAGLDVTPASFSEFRRKEDRKQTSGFPSFAGEYISDL